MPEDLRLALLENDIKSRPLWKLMHMQPIFGAVPCYRGIATEVLFENRLCLPFGFNLTNAERKRSFWKITSSKQ